MNSMARHCLGLNGRRFYTEVFFGCVLFKQGWQSGHAIPVYDKVGLKQQQNTLRCGGKVMQVCHCFKSNLVMVGG